MLVIRNIGQLVLPTASAPPVANTAGVATIENAFVAIDGECTVDFGRQTGRDLPPGEMLDAGGRCVIPGLVDCHTHTVFAGSREDEFVKRIKGNSYAQIAEEGGGIKNTVQAVRRASVDELIELALPRLKRMLARGVTTVEIKSGYGLTVDDELKMLEAASRLGALQPIEIVGTYLGAHTVPAEFADDRDGYIEMITDDALLSRIKDEGLAEFCDVFTERTAFTVEESRRVLLAGKRFGLVPRLHADQITQMGATRLAAEVGAISAEHLERIDDGGIEAMKDAGVMGVLLPGCSWFLGVEQAPARRIIDAGIPVAIATDLNPGSSMVESLPLCMSIACTQMRMTPAECVIAATANAAAALNRGDRIGRIGRGLQADLVILDLENYNQLPYHAGRNCAKTVIKRGEVVT